MYMCVFVSGLGVCICVLCLCICVLECVYMCVAFVYLYRGHIDIWWLCMCGVYLHTVCACL